MTALRFFACLLTLLGLCGCGITENLAANLARAITNSDDPATIEAGSPAYLIMIDAFLEDDPDDEGMLRIAAELNATYAEIFVDQPQRAKSMSSKALRYAQKAACQHDDSLCQLSCTSYEEFEARLANLDDLDDVPYLYTLAVAWAGWIQSHRDELKAMADISRVEQLMEQAVKLDETYKDGSGHLYLGALAILLPPSVGGQPEEARRHFERAIELGGERNLMAKVVFAEKYGRMMFDQELHDRLLNEVLAAQPRQPGFTLSNTLAQQRATELLADSQDYF